MANPNMFHHHFHQMDAQIKSLLPVWSFPVRENPGRLPQHPNPKMRTNGSLRQYEASFPSSFRFAASNLSEMSPCVILHPGEAIALSCLIMFEGGSVHTSSSSCRAVRGREEGEDFGSAASSPRDSMFLMELASLLCPETVAEILFQRSILCSPHDEFPRQLFLHCSAGTAPAADSSSNNDLMMEEIFKSRGSQMLTKNVKFAMAAGSRLDLFRVLLKAQREEEVAVAAQGDETQEKLEVVVNTTKQFLFDVIRQATKLGDVGFLAEAVRLATTTTTLASQMEATTTETDLEVCPEIQQRRAIATSGRGRAQGWKPRRTEDQQQLSSDSSMRTSNSRGRGRGGIGLSSLASSSSLRLSEANGVGIDDDASPMISSHHRRLEISRRVILQQIPTTPTREGGNSSSLNDHVVGGLAVEDQHESEEWHRNTGGGNGLMFSAIEFDHAHLLRWFLKLLFPLSFSVVDGVDDVRSRQQERQRDNDHQYYYKELSSGFNLVGALDPKESPLHYALKCGSLSCLEVLWVELIRLSRSRRGEEDDAISSLLLPEPLFLLDSKGRNVLHLACELQNIKALHLLTTLIGDCSISGGSMSKNQVIAMALSLPLGHPTRTRGASSCYSSLAFLHPPPRKRGIDVSPFGEIGCLTLAIWGCAQTSSSGQDNRGNSTAPDEKTSGVSHKIISSTNVELTSASKFILQSPTASYLLNFFYDQLDPSLRSQYSLPEYAFVALHLKELAGPGEAALGDRNGASTLKVEPGPFSVSGFLPQSDKAK